MIELAAFDLDGVLVEAPELHKDALNEALQQYEGFKLTDAEHITDFNGLPTRTKLSKLMLDGRVQEQNIEDIYEYKQKRTIELLSEHISYDEKIVELLLYCVISGLKIACVTNAIRSSAELMLDLCGAKDHIDLLISNQDVYLPKPSPEGYKKALKHFDLQPEQAIIVEDSPKGLEAAYATGCYVWQVGGVHDVNVENFEKFLRCLKNPQ